jgi:dolichyl-phosphate-mannose--protein O-mannosyl transferase
MALALFFFTSVYFFRHWWKNIEAGKGLVPASTVLLGMSVGCALASKHSAVALFPVTGCIMLHYIIGEKAGVRKPVFELAGIAVTVYFVLFTIYGFNPLTEYYWPGL